MKKFFISMLAISALMIMSCGDDDDIVTTDDDATGGDAFITGTITSDQTLTNDRVWELRGRTIVSNSATLTIEPGTIIKAIEGQAADASVLIIARGAQIQANGTAAQPIIFTSELDDIQVGQTAGTELDENDRGLWGGLIILGNAPSSFRGDVSELQIEGIPASDSNGLYGGSNAADNSGTLNYISIRHGGTNIGANNEINGLTLGGVGNGTTISNIEVVANFDDGIEFFGGTVNATNLFVWAVGDDSIDIDQAYSGTIDNVGIVLGDISDHAFEIDGPEGSLQGSFTLTNATLFGNTSTVNGEYAQYRDNALGTTSNIFATGFKVDSTVELQNNAVARNYLDGDLVFTNWVIELPAGVASSASVFIEETGDGEMPITTFTQDAAMFSSAGTTGGANLSAFAWTFANNRASLGF